MTNNLVIAGFAESDKVPGFVGNTIYGAGAISAASIPLTLLICGLKLTSWSTGLTPDVSVQPILSTADADAAWGAGSEGARMARAALRVPDISILGCAPTPAAGAAATATITVVAVPTTAGSWAYRIGGQLVTGGINTTDTATTLGTAIKNAINAADPPMPVTATSSAGVVTLTWNALSIRGNLCTVYQQISQLSAGVTSTLAGGAALVSSTAGESGVYLSGGTLAESMTAMLATLFPGRTNRIAAAQNDSVSQAAWVVQQNAKAGPLEGRTEHLVLALNGTVSAAETLASATVNNWRFELAELLNGETHPSEVAAVLAAVRTQTEQNQPNSGYDGVVLPGVVAQCSKADWAQRATQQAMLNSGVTPLVSHNDGSVTVSRAITTHCLSGSTPDFRTLDTAQAVVPDFVRDGLKLFWTTVYLVANPYVKDNSSPLEKDPPAGVATPNGWSAAANGQLLGWQNQNILTEVELNPPASAFDNVADRIMSAVIAIPLPLNHQIGVSVYQALAA